MWPMWQSGPKEDGQAETAPTEHQLGAPSSLGGCWGVSGAYPL